MSLFSRNDDLPGLHGALRDLTTPVSKGVKKFGAGDIAVVDAPDISRLFAQQLIDAHPVAVVNLAQFSSGMIPNFGPQMLLDAGIFLVEGVGAELRSQFKDGKKGRVTEDGTIYIGENAIGSGAVIERDRVENSFVDAQRSLVDHMEAYFGNTIELVRSEAPLFIDGLGIPDTGVDLAGRKVVVVSPGAGHRDELARLKNFIQEFEPVIIGVNEGGDTLVEVGYTPHLLVGDPATMAAETLRSGARVILPADPDGHAVGLERIQDLGVGAMTFPTAIDSATDLALLLADYHGGELIVNVGAPVDLDSVFRREPGATPSALLARLKAGSKLVDGNAVASLYTTASSGVVAWLWAILGILVALAVIVVIAGTSGDGSFVDNLIDTWNNIALSFQDLFR